MTDREISKVEFVRFKELSKKGNEGLVLFGAGGDLNLWVEGITKILFEAEIIPSNNPDDVFIPSFVETTGGRTDLLMMFKEGAQIQMGKLALWRLGYGDCSWLSDYVVNYADQHPEPESSEKIPLQVTGEWDGNIFAILGYTNKSLREIGRKDLIKSTTDKVTSSKNYSEALNHCMEVLDEAGYEVQ